MLWLFLCLFISSAFSITQEIYQPKKCTELNLMPMPIHIKCNIKSIEQHMITNPCQISYNIITNNLNQHREHLYELIQHQQYKTFGCRSIYFNEKSSENAYQVKVQLTKADLASAFTTKQQAYTLKVDKINAQIKANHYVGFVRALETFLQIITCNKDKKKCYMLGLPIQIQDQPLFQFRGILIDTSRHFIPMSYLKETVDAMMYNKLNIFHWHIVDEDSFPLQLESHPQIAEYAAFSPYQTYKPNEIRDFIKYALIRGVRVIPQVDTPGHAASWSRSPQNRDIACALQKKPYKGPLDVTLDKTYKIVGEVFKQIFELFPDPYVHLGGDEVELQCLANKTQFIKLQNIKEQEIQMQYRRKQRKMLKQLNSSKTFIYWIHNKITYIEPDDILHWWGNTGLLPANVDNRKIIISWSKGPYYIDMGAGNVWGTPYHEYSTWLDLYRINIGNQVAKQKAKDNVMGAEVTLWSEVSNLYTIHTKIWIRSSAFAQRVWTSVQHTDKPDVFRRITAHERLMNRRGIPTAPATCQQCEKNPIFC